MDQYLSAGLFALGGVLVGGIVQAILFAQKSRSEAKDRIRLDKIRFAADVFLYLRLIRGINDAESANRAKGSASPLSEGQGADLSARYRAVVASTHALIGSADIRLAEDSELFLKAFANYADAHRGISTGRLGRYEPQEPLEALAARIRKRKVSLPWPWEWRRRG